MSRLMFDEKKVTSARNLPPTDAALDLLTRVAKPSTPAAAAVSSSTLAAHTQPEGDGDNPIFAHPSAARLKGLVA